MDPVFRPPEDDLENRVPVWDALQMLFMDTDPEEYVSSMVQACATSPYTLVALEEILFQELLPSLRPNLASVAGEWRGFQSDALRELILDQHRFGKGRPVFFRKYCATWWERLQPLIQEARSNETR